MLNATIYGIQSESLPTLLASYGDEAESGGDENDLNCFELASKAVKACCRRAIAFLSTSSSTKGFS